MATTLNILSWNIRDVGQDQVDDTDFIKLVAKVVHEEQCNFVSILETKGDLGNELGKRVAKKLGAGWAWHSSAKSAPWSNKPENYVFIWKRTVLGLVQSFFPDDKKGGAYQNLAFPHKHNNAKNKSPSRFPFVVKFSVDPNGAKIPLTVVSFHTCFTNAWICEANQNLAEIPEVSADANVLVMGDFNDHPDYGRTYKGVKSFHKLTNTLGFSVEVADETSVAADYQGGWSTTDTLSSKYDNCFVKLGGGHVSQTGRVVDLMDALTTGKYLESLGKKVFNNYVTRKNVEYAKKGKILIDPFGAGDSIADPEDAHEVYREAISDHLPISLKLTFP